MQFNVYKKISNYNHTAIFYYEKHESRKKNGRKKMMEVNQPLPVHAASWAQQSGT